jgi:hypothetical protein
VDADLTAPLDFNILAVDGPIIVSTGSVIAPAIDMGAASGGIVSKVMQQMAA